jgi:tyrosinase
MTTPVPAQAVVRPNAYAKGGTFDNPDLLWYAKGIAAMRQRPHAEPTSWRFYAAIHGVDQQTWTDLGFWGADEAPPSQGVQAKLWAQCQHGSWYFLPWHRGYLLAFEAVVREAIIAAGGPADWALPYWDYFENGQAAIPPAFTRDATGWPGPGPNPLFVGLRFGSNPLSDGSVAGIDINLLAMAEDGFAGTANGAVPGFGGPRRSTFDHGTFPHGALEQNPHDLVHVLVGEPDEQAPPGLMSNPDTAALDPIFWLHHANIDRLWEAWRRATPSHADPTASRWLHGPTDRRFIMPLPGGTTWTYTPADVDTLTALNYSYEDLAKGTAPPSTFAMRMERLGARAAVRQGAAVPEDQNVELVGANDQSLTVTSTGAHTTVQLDDATREKLTASLANATTGGVPDRVFLNLENIRGQADGVTLRVYINLPDGADPARHPELLAGSVGLFGVTTASRRDREHGGDGFTAVLEITRTIDDLHLNAAVPDSLNVTVVPRKPLPAAVDLTIGRISLYRQGN